MQFIGVDYIKYEKLNFAHDLAGLKQKNVLFKFDENLIRVAKNDANNPNFSIVCADENYRFAK